MKFDIGGIGTAAAETAANSILGIALQKHNDRRQIRQQQKLGEQQLGFDMRMTDYQLQKQLQMWKDTNYSAQVEQMKMAGLNPALLYGMSGGGGQSIGGNAASVNAPQAPHGGGEVIGMMNARLNLGLMEAQKEVLESQAEKNKADAEKTRGVDTEKTVMETKSLAAGIEDTKAREALHRADEKLRQLQISFQQHSFEDQLEMLEYNVGRALADMENAQNTTFINKATRNEQIKTIQLQTVEAGLRNILLGTQNQHVKQQIAQSQKEMQLIDQQIQESAARILQQWAHVGQGAENTQANTRNSFTNLMQAETQRIKTLFETNHPNLWNVIGAELEDIRQITQGWSDGILGTFDIFREWDRKGSKKGPTQ